ncbi:hypothetical protein [Stieleria varia]|uniref:Uncharacterized protein n=1 Tax=Stieleria varia TaxID=2528005 RepID=A0A5C6BB56_9BACT|nr:hypothetical protein [Stieleria varia]TWU08496.1 hypothetical protein Pla52n_10790 [Stieleria varia]
MRKQNTLLYFFTFVAFACAAMMTARADEQPPIGNAVPDGSAEKISDWALAGVIWSDASLTRKLAFEAAKRSESAPQRQKLQAIAKKSNDIVDALEKFGWKQIKRTAPTTLDPSIKRFDTETPAGFDDPGLDDEQTDDKLRLDVDQYRVDDYIDETPAEARNRADAIEDGVEGAIAAAASRRGMGRPTAGRISEREVQTRSATMPYSQDSIYDSDDYDPDRDYIVDNPLGVYSTNPASADLGDGDDDIDLDDPAKVVEGEDELIAAMARERRADASRADASRADRQVEMDCYTDRRSSHQQDANWVQLHLDANQATWSQFTTHENITARTSDAVMKLKADASAASDATTSPELLSILDTILER